MMNLLVGGAALLSLMVQSHQQSDRTAAAYTRLFSTSNTTWVQATDTGQGRAIPLPQPGLPQRAACNMPMIAGNAQVDPKIVKPIEKGNIDAKIRAIEPPVCWEKKETPN